MRLSGFSFKWRFLWGALFFCVFVYGFGVGRYMWWPAGLLLEAKKQLDSQEPSKEIDPLGEMLKYAFVDPLYGDALLYPPIKSFSEVNASTKSNFIAVKKLSDSYLDISLKGWSSLDIAGKPVVRVDFAFRGRDYAAYAYGRVPGQCGAGKASLIIPGTGHNQSTAIYADDQSNYHYGALQIAQVYGGTSFVLVKPNEDFLAWHNGKHKLSMNFYVNWYLNNGGSYSYSYIVQSMAFMKFMKSCFSETALVGLSQGGSAVLLNAIQSKPDYALIFSGYTVMDEVNWSGFNQIIINGINEFLSPDKLTAHLAGTPTHYLFSWGEDEVGYYGVEAREKKTCQVLIKNKNVSCESHPGAHVFSVETASGFLSRKGSL